MKPVLITTSSFGVQSDEPLKTLAEAGFHAVLNPLKRKLTEAEVSELIEKNSPVGIIAGVEPLTSSVFDKANALKAIARCGIGMDSVDLDAAKKKGIKVTNTPDAPTIPVAELTMGMILSLLRKIPLSDSGIKSGNWVRPTGNLLQGKTVGLIGCGRIGKMVAKFLQPFECRINGYDPFLEKADRINILPIEDVLKTSDIISLHLPYNDETHHMFDLDKISLMKKGAVIINAARGGLIDEKALCDFLKSGHLAGAAIDCFETEPYSGPLTQLENVVLTGHIGSYAKEGRILMETQAVDNLINSLNNV